MAQKKTNHGGARENAGRKYRGPGAYITIYVLEDEVKKVGNSKELATARAVSREKIYEIWDKLVDKK